MKSLLTATAAFAFLAAPAFAQTDASPTLEQNTVTGDDQQMKANDGDDALPGSANAGASSDIDTSTTSSTAGDATVILPGGDASVGPSAQPFTEGTTNEGAVEESTPSDGVVPGQDPE